MATATIKNRCVICGKEKASFKCEGCSQTFCYNHVTDHRQELSQQLDEIEVTRDIFRQTLTEQITEPRKHPLIQQIDTWERDSINKIRRTADEARQLLLKHTTDHAANIEVKLAKLTDQLRENRQGNDFVETDLNHWKDELTRLTKELGQPPNVFIRQTTTPLVTNILVDVPTSFGFINIGINARWIQHGRTVAGGNGNGNEINQLSHSWAFYIDDDETIYIADGGNNRIMRWKCGETSGQVVVNENGRGNQTNQLNDPRGIIVDRKKDFLIICDQNNRRVVRWPRQRGTDGQIIISDIDCDRLTMDSDGYLYVSDYSRNEVRRWRVGDTHGTIVAGGNGPGDHFSQLNTPTGIFVDHERSVYVSDSSNNRVMKWMKGAEEGIVVAGGNGRGDSLSQLSQCYGMIVDQYGTVYVSDYGNHRIIRWLKGATKGSTIVGGNGEGAQANQLNNPTDLAFDRQGNLYVLDTGNQRLQKFNIDPNSSQ